MKKKRAGFEGGVKTLNVLSYLICPTPQLANIYVNFTKEVRDRDPEFVLVHLVVVVKQ